MRILFVALIFFHAAFFAPEGSAKYPFTTTSAGLGIPKKRVSFKRLLIKNDSTEILKKY